MDLSCFIDLTSALTLITLSSTLAWMLPEPRMYHFSRVNFRSNLDLTLAKGCILVQRSFKSTYLLCREITGVVLQKCAIPILYLSVWFVTLPVVVGITGIKRILDSSWLATATARNVTKQPETPQLKIPHVGKSIRNQ